MAENVNPNVIPSSPRALPRNKFGKSTRRYSRNRCSKKHLQVSSSFDSVPDQVLVLMFSKLAESQRKLAALVCKRWLRLQGRVVEAIRVLDWGFLESGRLVERFGDLRDVDLVDACVRGGRWWNVVLSQRLVSVDLSDGWIGNVDGGGGWIGFVDEDLFVSKEEVDEGLRVLGCGLPRLRRLATVAGTEMGLLSVAEGCPNLEELELRRCCDNTLRAIAAFENLKKLKLHGNVGVAVTNIGLTILAQGCKMLVRLELTGCEGSYEGIKAIGQCCQMLEELVISDHKLDDGWLAGLSYCQNLKNLSFQFCQRSDDNPDPDEYLSCCPSLERLYLQKCQLRSCESLQALFKVCDTVREIAIQDCWGLTNDMFILIRTCRRVNYLSLEGCSLITTTALESVVCSLSVLERLEVVSCKNVKNSEISPALSTLFTDLQELKWMPDAKSLLSSSFANVEGKKKGGKFFRK